ncbi:MAG: trypsin-like peptidase domain-containing protein [Pirellulales bacterium]
MTLDVLRRYLTTSLLLCTAGIVTFAGSTAARSVELDPAVVKLEDERIAAVAKATPSVVAIFVPGGAGGGSGVVVTPDGFVVTNFHVAKPCGTFMKCGLSDGKLYDAVIVGIDPVGDVALIKMHGRKDFVPAEMADSDEVRVGDFCFAMGNPFLLATDFTPTISYGVVSGTHRYQYPANTFLEYADCIQTDAAINPGNSGGPLFDSQGRLIGINGRGSFEKRGRVNVGVGYAISINQVKKFMGALRSGRVLDHATLGAQLTTSDQGKVVVTNILESSDAFRRGLRPDDEVIAFGGRPIKTVNAYKNYLGTFPRDWRVPLTFRRDGTEQTINVRLLGDHREDELKAIMEGSENPDEKRRPGKNPPGKNPPGKTPGPKFDISKLLKKDNGPPAELKKLFEARERFANYYFNKLEQDRLWNGLREKAGDFSKLNGTWTITGKMNPGSDFKFTLGPEKAKSELPVGDSEIEVKEGLAEALNPPGSGGLLAALHLWKSYLVDGPGKFGKLEYVGTLPRPGREELCDVVVGTTKEIDIRFYFDPQGGRLAALEFFSDEQQDPCEVSFESYREVDGRRWPENVIVRFGDRIFGTFEFTKIDAATLPAVDKPKE